MGTSMDHYGPGNVDLEKFRANLQKVITLANTSANLGQQGGGQHAADSVAGPVLTTTTQVSIPGGGEQTAEAIAAAAIDRSAPVPTLAVAASSAALPPLHSVVSF